MKRVCLAIFPHFLQFDEKLNRLGGPLAEYWSVIFGPIFDANTTYLFEKLGGFIIDHEKEMYNGCVGSLQRNESDVAVINAFYPTLAHGIKQGAIYGSDAFFFTAMYNKTTAFRENDIMDAMQVFDSLSVMCVVIFLVTFFALFVVSLSKLSEPTSMVRQSMMERRGSILKRSVSMAVRSHRLMPYKESMKVILGNSIQQFNSYHVGDKFFTDKLLIFFLTTLGFYIYNFFSSAMSVDMVTIEPPKLIQSIDELMEKPQIGLAIIEFDGEKNFFESAPDDSKKRKISSRLVELNPAAVAESPDLDFATNVVKRIQLGEMVVIHKTLQEKALNKALCKFISDNPSIRKWNGGKGIGRYIKSITEEFLVGYLMSDSASETTSHLLDKRITRVREGNLLEGVYLHVNDVASSLLPGDPSFEHMEECINRKIVLETPQVMVAGWHYYREMFWLFGASLMLVFLIVVMERLFYNSVSSISYRKKESRKSPITQTTLTSREARSI